MEARPALVLSYYRRLVAAAWDEAKRVTATRVTLALAIAVFTFVYTWALADVATITSLLVGVLAAATVAVVVFVYYCVTIPARIEGWVEMARRDVQVVQQKRAIQETMRQIASQCQNVAAQGRRDILNAQPTGGTVNPDPIHAQTLDLAGRAKDLLKNYAQFGYAQEEAEISRVVDGTKSSGAEEAITALVELQRVIEMQVYSGRYLS